MTGFSTRCVCVYANAYILRTRKVLYGLGPNTVCRSACMWSCYRWLSMHVTSGTVYLRVDDHYSVSTECISTRTLWHACQTINKDVIRLQVTYLCAGVWLLLMSLNEKTHDFFFIIAWEHDRNSKICIILYVISFESISFEKWKINVPFLVRDKKEDFFGIPLMPKDSFDLDFFVNISFILNCIMFTIQK